MKLLLGALPFPFGHWPVLEATSSNISMADRTGEFPGPAERLETKQKIEKFVKESLDAHEEVLATTANSGNGLERPESACLGVCQQEARETSPNASSSTTPAEEGNAFPHLFRQWSKNPQQPLSLLCLLQNYQKARWLHQDHWLQNSPILHRLKILNWTYQKGFSLMYVAPEEWKTG